MGWIAEVMGSGKPEGFARSVIAALRRAGYAGEIRLDAAEFTLHFDGDGGDVFDLHNVFEEYAAVPRLARPRWFRDLANMQMAMRATRAIRTFEEARPLLLPRLRARFYYAALRLRRRARLPAPEADVPQRDVSPHHIAEIVCDFPTHVTTVTDDDLARWGVTFDEAFAVGLANLRHVSLGAVAQLGDGAYCAMSGDSHDASRLLVPEVFARFEVRGDLVAIAPHRDSLLFAGADDAASLGVIADLAEKGFEDPRAITELVVVVSTIPASQVAKHKQDLGVAVPLRADLVEAKALVHREAAAIAAWLVPRTCRMGLDGTRARSASEPDQLFHDGGRESRPAPRSRYGETAYAPHVGRRGGQP